MKQNMTAPNHLNCWNKKRGIGKKANFLTHTYINIHICFHTHTSRKYVCEYMFCSDSSNEYEQLASSVWLMEEKKFHRKINPSFSWQSVCQNGVNERKVRDWKTKNNQHLYCCMCILVTYNVKMIPCCVCVCVCGSHTIRFFCHSCLCCSFSLHFLFLSGSGSPIPCRYYIGWWF